MSKNIDLGKTKITDKIRVSTAAIFYSGEFGDYYLFETWVFSEDKERQKSRQIIHGTCKEAIPFSMLYQAERIHRRISNVLIRKFNSSTLLVTGDKELDNILLIQKG